MKEEMRSYNDFVSYFPVSMRYKVDAF